jgi:hypothetical protein
MDIGGTQQYPSLDDEHQQLQHGSLALSPVNSPLLLQPQPLLPLPAIMLVVITKVNPSGMIMKMEKVLSKRAKNWWSWSQSMWIMFDINKLTRYINGTIHCPNPRRDPVSANNWQYNDSYTRMIIRNNIATSEE